jgi:hypothetical protein
MHKCLIAILLLTSTSAIGFAQADEDYFDTDNMLKRMDEERQERRRQSQQNERQQKEFLQRAADRQFQADQTNKIIVGALVIAGLIGGAILFVVLNGKNHSVRISRPTPSAPQSRFCTQCGAGATPVAKFCSACGAKI